MDPQVMVAHQTSSCSHWNPHVIRVRALLYQLLPPGLCPVLSCLPRLLPGLLQEPPPCSLGSHLALQVSFQQPEREPGPVVFPVLPSLSGSLLTLMKSQVFSTP